MSANSDVLKFSKEQKHTSRLQLEGVGFLEESLKSRTHPERRKKKNALFPCQRQPAPVISISHFRTGRIHEYILKLRPYI